MVIAFIPARGKSKRLPRKNIRMFSGKPLLAYSIEAARSCSLIDECFVSTDDKEIAEVARAYGAGVIDRPDEISGDFSSTAEAARHALQFLGKRGLDVEALVTLQPTNPLRNVSLHIDEAIRLFHSDPTLDSVITVTLNKRKIGRVEDGYFVPDYEAGARSQDLPETYFENGLVYVTRAAVVLENCDLHGKRIKPLFTDPLYALADIDTELDFNIAELLFEKYRENFDYE